MALSRAVLYPFGTLFPQKLMSASIRIAMLVFFHSYWKIKVSASGWCSSSQLSIKAMGEVLELYIGEGPNLVSTYIGVLQYTINL